MARNFKQYATEWAWEDVIKKGFKEYVIILDVDGTLLPDGEREIRAEIKTYLEILKKENEVYLLSNSRAKGRIESISGILGVESLKTRHRKPNPMIKKALPKNGKPVLVIGDKLSIDGVLAMLIGADLVIMKRQLSTKDRWFVKLGYVGEDLLFSFLQLFVGRKKN